MDTAQSCQFPCQQKGALRQWQGNRHHCLSVCDGLGGQSVGKAEYRHAKVIGFGSLSHRAGGAVASSVTMRPRESLRFVTEAHRHLSPVREAGCSDQPQRRRTAITGSQEVMHVLRRIAFRALWRWVSVSPRLRIVAGIPVQPLLVIHSYGKVT